MPATTKSNSRRRADLAMIHMAAKKLFGDVSSGGDGREDYEDWLERQTGKRSSGKLTTAERIELIKHIRKNNLIPDRNRGGVGQTAGGEERPTQAQWNKMGGLARDMGWDRGLGDNRLHAFAERTAKISSARFMTRRQASKVILGLEEWVRQRRAKKESGNHAMP